MSTESLKKKKMWLNGMWPRALSKSPLLICDTHRQKWEQIQTQNPYILYQTMEFWEDL